MRNRRLFAASVGTTMLTGLFILLSSVPARAAEKPKEKTPSPEARKAIVLFNDGDKEGATEAFRKVIEAPGANPYDLFISGEFCFNRLQKLDLAIQAYEKLFAMGEKAKSELGPRDFWMAHDAMGICLGMSGKFEKSADVFQAGKKLAKELEGTERWTCEYNLACTFGEWGKPDLAVAELRTYLEGMRADLWKIDREKISRDSSFKSLLGREDFRKLMGEFSGAKGDPAKDAKVVIPADGRKVEVVLPETTAFETSAMPEYCIRMGSAEGTKFTISLNRNLGDFKSLKELAETVYKQVTADCPPEGKKFIDKKTFFVHWVKTEIGGTNLSQLSIRGYYQDRDLYLDLHVSAMNPTAEDEKRMMGMIESVRFIKTVEKK